jgi:hypothetical protein
VQRYREKGEAAGLQSLAALLLLELSARVK